LVEGEESKEEKKELFATQKDLYKSESDSDDDDDQGNGDETETVDLITA